MKITKRSLFVLVPLIAVVGTAGALQFRKPPANTRTAQVQKQSIPQAAQEATSPVTIAAEEPNPTPPAPTPTTAPAPVTPPPAPVYGEDPNNPGVFVVFDKEAVMNQAGIAEADKQYVTKVAGGWIYKAPSANFNVCNGIEPRSRMAVSGADYDTNPVTQLKYCKTWVEGRYGTWENAYAAVLKHMF